LRVLSLNPAAAPNRACSGTDGKDNVNTTLFVARSLILLGASAGLLGATPLAVAADTSAVAAQAAKTVAAPEKNGSVTVKKGDTLLRIIERNLNHLPFKQEILRSAIMQKNPAAFKKGKPETLVAGTVLELPTIEDFRGMVPSVGTVGAIGTASEDVHAELKSDPRKGWVRFP